MTQKYITIKTFMSDYNNMNIINIYVIDDVYTFVLLNIV